MYASNHRCRNAFFGVCLSGVVAGALYVVKNYERFACWNEDAVYSAVIADRGKSTGLMLDTVSSRVDTMTPDELRRTAEQCESLHENIMLRYVECVSDLGERKFLSGERTAVRHVLQSLDCRLEAEDD